MLVILSERVMNNAQLIITVLLTTEVFFQSKTAWNQECGESGVWSNTVLYKCLCSQLWYNFWIIQHIEQVIQYCRKKTFLFSQTPMITF